MSSFDNWRIVLVRPRNPLNIGAAARAMANFGFRDLVLVEPYEPVWKEARSAVGARALLGTARAVATLAEAVADRSLVAGTTSGSRRKLGGDLLPLPALPARAVGVGKVALLFGPEKTGLTNEHLSYCHLLVRIPTVAASASMNLAQAVAVCCYELSRVPAPPQPRRQPQRAPVGGLEQFRAELQELLRSAGFYPSPVRPSDTLKLRRLLLGLNLGDRDLPTLRGMVAQLRWKLRLKT